MRTSAFAAILGFAVYGSQATAINFADNWRDNWRDNWPTNWPDNWSDNWPDNWPVTWLVSLLGSLNSLNRIDNLNSIDSLSSLDSLDSLASLASLNGLDHFPENPCEWLGGTCEATAVNFCSGLNDIKIGVPCGSFGSISVGTAGVGCCWHAAI
ncbi:hypothetical protein TGAM01_v206216 [Trichoderma gamsii]|uniref:Hydrophobin n=1 Tax=Trichoderma gamsii TaxID=398673 RepID=A0A2P4ZKB5_9HYPO|nr:hypothetical protein TGAM01_v206216 [Trichoderma gamsii]PON24708.1 hypothetical protein TGAM01_v206216 [Trichoderma gamsii]